MAFTDQEKTDIRRLCGYPPIGTLLLAGPAGVNPVAYRIQVNDFEDRLVSLTPTEEAAARGILKDALVVEASMLTMAGNLDVAKAAVFTRNPLEMQERMQLLGWYRGRLLAALGAAFGPGLGGGSSPLFGVAARG
ncbi:hypothetical protein [Roseomonas chloroacetimidivorans]|uniref:hypothetical protein n=1 Tax=Roseomonas chloroacetimidivorans TaxID=1766656 RepID=UPI003C71EF5B